MPDRKVVEYKHCSKRCGKCCKGIPSGVWKETTYQYPLLDILKKANFPPSTDCDMLRMDGDIAVCMLQELFGYEAKPEDCKTTFCKDAIDGRN